MPAPTVVATRGRRQVPRNPADIGAVRAPYPTIQRVPVIPQATPQVPSITPATSVLDPSRLTQEAQRQSLQTQNLTSGFAALMAQQQQAMTEGLAGQIQMMEQLQAKQQKQGLGKKGGKFDAPLRGLLSKAEPAGFSHVGNNKLYTHHGVTMAGPALASLMRAGKMLGQPIPGGGYRTLEQQTHLNDTNPASVPTAEPGTSLHEQGIAIDIPMDFLNANPKVVKILERLGWHRWNASVEPWHFSFKEIG